MANQEHVTVKTYADAADAVAAEILLYENGFSTDDVKRNSTRVRVTAARAEEARALLEAATPGTDATADADTGVIGSATGAVTGAAAAAADTVQDVASSAVDSAQQAVGAVVDKVQDATSVVTEAVGQVSDVAASKVESLADTVYEAGVTPDASGVQRTAARTAASALDKTAEYLREGDISLILEDLRGAIRRNPGRSLLVGLGLGYLARGTFFGASGSQTGSRQPQAPEAQAVPVYTGSVGGSYDASLDMPSSVAGTTFDSSIAGSTTEGSLSGVDIDTTLYGASSMPTDATPSAVDSLPETMLYGTDDPSLGADFGQGSSTSYAGADVTGTELDSMSGLDTDTGTGGLSDLSTGSDLGDAGGDFGSPGDVDLRANSIGMGDTELDQDLMDTNQSSSTSIDDQLRQWDANTRRDQS